MMQYFVLFPNHLNGIKLNSVLRQENYQVNIAPTPRELSASCGISLRIREDDIEAIRRIIEREKIQIIDIVSLEKENDPLRDRFC